MISRSPKEYELTKTIETLENTIKILKKLRAVEKKAWKKNAGKAHSDVRSLGKAEVAGSIPVASSKRSRFDTSSIESWGGPGSET